MRHAITAALAAITAAAVPYTFSPGTPARSAEVNANFSELDTRLTSVTSDLTAVQRQLAVSGTGPAKVATAETDIAQLEDGATPATTGRACDASGTTCVYRLTAGPFVLLAVDQTNHSTTCVAPCPERIGRVFYFAAPDDATALTIAAASVTAGPAVRWLLRSYSWDDPYTYAGGSNGMGRYLVRPGEYLYSYHPPAPPLVADAPTPPFVYGSATGHWSGYHPY